MVKKNLDRSFFRFVTVHAFDRQTAFSSLDHVCIACSAVKTNTTDGKLFKKRCLKIWQESSEPLQQ